jgi:hypothetical protein
MRIGGTLPFGPQFPSSIKRMTGRHHRTLYDTWPTRVGLTRSPGSSYRSAEWNDTGVVFQVPTYGTGTPNGDPLNAAQAFRHDYAAGINGAETGNPLSLYGLWSAASRVQFHQGGRPRHPSTTRWH